MKTIFATVLLCWFAAANAGADESSAPAEPKILQVFDWKELAASDAKSQMVSLEGTSVLKVANTNATHLTATNAARVEITLATISNSALIAKSGMFISEMKYENVREEPDLKALGEGRISYGYIRGGELRLVEVFAPEAAGGDEVSSKVDCEFKGSSNWTPLKIKIFRNYAGALPVRIELRLFLQTSGTVWLRPVKLLETPGSSDWWSSQQAGLIGGIGGSVIGCFGALLGLLASKGKARGFVLTTVKIFIALGILLTIAGLVAVVSKQPYAVWYALLLPGVILTLVFSLNLPSIQRRYDDLEIRRMASIDARGS